MLDKSVPYYQVFMTKNDIEKFDKHELPDGYTIYEYKVGMAIDWVRLQMYYEQYDTFGEALNYFKKMYIEQGNMIYERLLFVKDEDDLIIGTGALWVGTHFGNVMHKIQGVAIHPQYRNKGIAKAIVSRLYEIAVALECKGGLYTNASTWNYPFINLLFKMGFVAYMGKKPKNHAVTADDYEDNNKLAWEIIMNKIAAYNKKHVDAENERFGSL